MGILWRETDPCSDQLHTGSQHEKPRRAEGQGWRETVCSSHVGDLGSIPGSTSAGAIFEHRARWSPEHCQMCPNTNTIPPHPKKKKIKASERVEATGSLKRTFSSES